MLTEKLTRGDSIALTKGLLIAAWRFCHNELALSVSHSLASSPRGRATGVPVRLTRDEQSSNIQKLHRPAIEASSRSARCFVQKSLPS